MTRWLTLVVFSIWFGGFTFYAAVVVPTGSELLGVTEQGFVTQNVTRWLNWIGVLAVLLASWEVLAGTSRSAVNIVLVFALCATLIALFVLHGQLDRQLDGPTMTVLTGKSFYRWHQAYLWCSVLQWLAGLVVWARLASRPSISPPARSQSD